MDKSFISIKQMSKGDQLPGGFQPKCKCADCCLDDRQALDTGSCLQGIAPQTTGIVPSDDCGSLAKSLLQLHTQVKPNLGFMAQLLTLEIQLKQQGIVLV